jgi:uncharacterized protein YjeT (DUF2065 family)
LRKDINMDGLETYVRLFGAISLVAGVLLLWALFG